MHTQQRYTHTRDRGIKKVINKQIMIRLFIFAGKEIGRFGIDKSICTATSFLLRSKVVELCVWGAGASANVYECRFSHSALIPR